MRYYVRAEIERFLRAVDRALKRPATVIFIGGGAAALKYRIDDPTTDIDTFNALGADLRRAIDAARKATGLAMPFEQSGVADGPYDFEDRLLLAMPRLARLTVLVPESHDLALMKAVRGDQADFAAPGHPRTEAVRPLGAAPALRGGDGPRGHRSAAAEGELPGPGREPVPGGGDSRQEGVRTTGSAEPARCFPGVAGQEDAGAEEDPQETTLNTSSSVSSPWASANGATRLRIWSLVH